MKSNITKLGNLTSLISSGSTPKGGSNVYLETGEIMLIRSQNVLMRSLDLSDVAFIDEDTDNSMKRTHIKKNDVLLNITGASIGRVAVFDLEAQKANVNQHVCIIRPNTDDLDSKYLMYFLSCSEFQAKINGLQNGGTRQALNFSQIREFQIPILPIAQQKRIAAILDKADAVRRKRREAIRLTEELLRSTFLEMFGDPVTNPKGWDVAELGSLINSNSIITYGIVQAGEKLKSGVPYIRTSDIKDGIIEESELLKTSPDIAAKYKRSEVYENDLVISIRATVGTVAKVPKSLEGANLTQGTAKISVGEKMAVDYLLNFIRSQGCQHWISRQVKGVTFQEITLKRLREMPILVPPRFIQDEFCRFFLKVSQEKKNQLQFFQESENLFNSLLQRAFTGDL